MKEFRNPNQLEVALNLVPVIDLLSTLTLFLLVVASWVDVRLLNLDARTPAQTILGNKSSPNPPSRAASDPLAKPELRVMLSPPRCRFVWSRKSPHYSLQTTIPCSSDSEALDAVKRYGQANVPEPKTKALVQTADTFAYSTLVSAVDTLRTKGFLAGISLERLDSHHP